MSETKFAPAPWYVGGNGQDILWFDDKLDRCKIVATVAGYVQSEGIVPHGSGTASLIAAAPDLFHALKGLLGAYDAMLDQLANIPPTDHPASWRAIAAAAIAKAEPNRPTP